MFVISTLGIVVLSLRHDIDGWLNTDMGRHMSDVINSVLLKNLATDAQDKSLLKSANDNDDLVKAERHISLLNEKIDQQQKHINSLQAYCETLDSASARKNLILRSPCSKISDMSTSALSLSNEITPPEKKRRIQEKDARSRPRCSE